MKQIISAVVAIIPISFRSKLLYFQLLLISVSLIELLGVASIGPFMAMATNPSEAMQNDIGRYVAGFYEQATPYKVLGTVGIFFSLIVVVGNALSLYSKLASTRITGQLARDLSQTLFANHLRTSYQVISAKPSSDFVSNVTNDVNNLCNKLVFSLLQMNASVVTIVVLLGLILYINTKAALLVASIYFVSYFLIYAFVQKRLKANGYELALVNRAKVKVALEALASIVNVKSYGLSQYFQQSLSDEFKKDVALQCEHRLFQDLPYHAIDAVTFVAVVALVLVVTITENSTGSTISSLAILGLAGYRLIPRFQQIYRSLVAVKSNQRVLFELKKQLLAAKGCEVAGKPEREKPFHRLSLSNIRFQYNDAVQPIYCSSFELYPGDFVGIKGASGVGKSTVIKLMMGLLEPAEGEVSVLAGSDAKEVANTLPYTSLIEAETYVYSATVLDNLILFDESYNESDLQKALDVSGFKQVMEVNSLGLSSFLNSHSSDLSSGQRQKLGFARALYHAKPVLILDEATNALDEKSQSDILNAIKSRYPKLSIILVSHRPGVECFIDRLYTLDQGRLS